MRLKNSIDYKCFPEPSRGDWTRFTILVLSAKIRKAALRASAGLPSILCKPPWKGSEIATAAYRSERLSGFIIWAR